MTYEIRKRPYACKSACMYACDFMSKKVHTLESSESGCMSHREWEGEADPESDTVDTLSLRWQVSSTPSCRGVSAVVWVRGGQTGVRVLLEGLQGMRVLGGWQSNGWGEVTTRPSQMKLAGPRWQPKFQRRCVHLSFPLKPPPTPSYSPLECISPG